MNLFPLIVESLYNCNVFQLMVNLKNLNYFESTNAKFENTYFYNKQMQIYMCSEIKNVYFFVEP